MADVPRWLPVAVLGCCTVACGDPEIVIPELLGVSTVFPSHGSTQIATDVEGLVFFTHPVQTDPATAMITLECAGSPPCSMPVAAGCPMTAPDFSVAFDPGGQVARVPITTPLQADTCFVYVIAAGIVASDANVGPLPVEVRSAFQTQ